MVESSPATRRRLAGVLLATSWCVPAVAYAQSGPAGPHDPPPDTAPAPPSEAPPAEAAAATETVRAAPAEPSGDPPSAASDDDVVIILDDTATAPNDAAPSSDDVLVIEPDASVASNDEETSLPTFEEMRTWFSAELSSRLSVDANFDTSTREDVIEWWNVGRLRLDYKRGSVRAVIEAWGRWGVVAEDTKPDHDFAVFNARNPKWAGDVQLREGYASLNLWGIDLSVGQRIFVWGKNELFSPADVMNPMDIRYDPLGSLSSTKDGKLPILALDVAYHWESTAIQLVVAPFFNSDQAFLFGRDFSLASPGSLLDEQLRSIISVHPSIEDQLQQGVRGTEVPDESPQNATVALRASSSIFGWDLAATAYYGWDRLPKVHIDQDLLTLADAAPRISADPNVLVSDPELRETSLRVQQRLAVGEQLFSATYQRTWKFALELEGVIGDFVLRTDIGFSPLSNFYDRNLDLYRLPLFTGIVGAEYSYGEEWFVQVTAITMIAFDPPERGILVGLERQETDPTTRDIAALYGAAATVRYYWEWPEIEFQAACIATFSPGDLVLQGQVVYKYLEPHELQLGAVFLDGVPGSLADRFKRNDFFYLGYRGSW